MALSKEQKELVQHNLDTTDMDLKEVVSRANEIIFSDDPIKLADAKKEFAPPKKAKK